MNSIGHYIDLKTTTSTDSEKVSFLRIQVDVPLKEFPPIDLYFSQLEVIFQVQDTVKPGKRKKGGFTEPKNRKSKQTAQ